MEGGVRLCRDCRWHKWALPFNERPWCSHPSSTDPKTVDPVSGRTIRSQQYRCDIMRSSLVEGRCGPKGKYWEADDSTKGR
jgi:hypothetical protein